MSEKKHKLSFSWDELVEVRRALQLIMQEDASADVNMDAASIRAKESALAKLTKLTGRSRLEIAMETATSVDVKDVK